MDAVLGYLEGSPLHNRLDLDLSLARGLSYYTGCIFEVKALDYAMGSIGGGGRYADLTGIFGLKGLSGVGISFGADRIYDVMEGLGLFPDQAVSNLQVLVMVMDPQDHGYAFGLLSQLREAGIAADLYPEAAKVQKMMKYANAIGAAHVILIGESERQSGRPTLRNMADGTQESLDIQGIIARLSAR
jgi:histidyl-tRNA synthetase